MGNISSSKSIDDDDAALIRTAGKNDMKWLEVYQKLISMDFEEDVCMEAAKKHPNNIQKAIHYVLKHQEKKQRNKPSVFVPKKDVDEIKDDEEKDDEKEEWKKEEKEDETKDDKKEEKQNKNTAISPICECGNYLIKTARKHLPNGDIICDHCGEYCLDENDIIFYCNYQQDIVLHHHSKYGYYLCQQCGLNGNTSLYIHKSISSQKRCICNNYLIPSNLKYELSFYGINSDQMNEIELFCDECNNQITDINEIIYRCVGGNDPCIHNNGYYLCRICEMNLNKHSKLFMTSNAMQSLEWTTEDDIILDVPNGTYFKPQSLYPTIIGNVRLLKGKYYYEVILTAAECGAFGWGLHSQRVNTLNGVGTGYDERGWAYNGWTAQKWNKQCNDYGEKWKSGDVIGIAIDIDLKIMHFYRNGKGIGIAFNNFDVEDGIAPSISLQRGGLCTIVVNKEYFKYGVPSDGYKELPIPRIPPLNEIDIYNIDRIHEASIYEGIVHHSVYSKCWAVLDSFCLKLYDIDNKSHPVDVFNIHQFDEWRTRKSDNSPLIGYKNEYTIEFDRKPFGMVWEQLYSEITFLKITFFENHSGNHLAKITLPQKHACSINSVD